MSGGYVLERDKPNVSLLNHIAPFATVFTLSVAAMAYVTGAIYKNALLTIYGLDGGVINEPIQATMTKGFEALLQGGMLCAIILALTVKMLRLLFRITLIRRIVQGVVVTAVRRNPDRRRYLILFYLNCVAIVLFAAGTTAVTQAAFRHIIIQQRLSSNCSQCVLYNTKRGKVSGVPIMSDVQMIIIATRKGAVRLENSELKAWRTYSSKWMFWF